MRQLFQIKQVGSVTEYVGKFSELIDQLRAYDSQIDLVYHTMRFIDGLREDVKSTVLVQRPRNVDAACALSLLQDEVVKPCTKKEYKRPDSRDMFKHPSRGPLLLPAPPIDLKTLNPMNADERKVVEAGKSFMDKLLAL